MTELKLNVVGKVRRSEIPEQTRGRNTRGRRKSVIWTPIVNALDDLNRYEALKVEHNAKSAQALHAKLKMFLQANHDIPEIKVAVRGETAYFWLE